MGKGILTVNVGSSSLKLNVFADSEDNCLAQVSITSISEPRARLTIKTPQSSHEIDRPIANHLAAVTIGLEALTGVVGTEDVSVVSIRVVHGGERYYEPTRIDSELIDELRRISSLDPDHMPTTLEVIDILANLLPNAAHIACFDTGFFHNIPLVARTIPLPREYRDQGLRRYGFHGLSYSYVLDAFREVAGEEAANGRVVIAHLGSGASLAGLKNSKPVDMTMGLSPVSGIPMSTRSGDIDPSVVTHLARLGVNAEQYSHIINSESGLLGVSGISADMLTLLQLEDTRPEAHEAVDLFCYSARKSIGSLSAALGGIDSLIFTGGMGEHSPDIRARICDTLQYLGIEMDEARNLRHNELISSDTSRVGVHVIPTDESRILYRDALRIVQKINEGE